MSDVLALGALQAALELGVAVPENLSVVGFDDSPAAAFATPMLTTLAPPHAETGWLAAHWLLAEIAAGRPRRRRHKTILPTELVVRESTGPPPMARTRRRR